jgi:putative addiction module CopG family antidote
MPQSTQAGTSRDVPACPVSVQHVPEPASDILKAATTPVLTGIEPAMQITLPPEIQAIIENEIESGRFNTPDEVVIEALRHLQDATVPFIPDEWLSEARAQADRGEGRPLTEHVMRELLDRARDGAKRGLPVRDEVKY